MKTIHQIISVSKICFYTLLVSALLGCEDRIKVGQVWKHTMHAENPYRKAIIDYKEVIEITGEYILFIENNKDTLYERKYWFVVNSECVNHCN